MPARPHAVHSPGTNGPATPRLLLKDTAYARIKARLLSGEYAPGSFLSERTLADGLGMSKTPVKAALERLEAEGLIAVSPQQGIVVRELALNEIADQYEIRAALESYTVRAVAGRLTPAQERKLRANLDAQARLRGGTDLEAGVELDAAFHSLFPEFLGNQEIIRVVGQMREKIQRVVMQVFRLSPARLETSYVEHEAIARAVVAGDGEAAAGLIVTHLELGKRLILSPRA